jgi:ssDNA-binding Zn-finger/Zn-ribbon topoisomerase 1
MKCPYCGKNKICVDSTVIYGKGYNFGVMYACEDYPKCDTYCGKGATLANKELRELRKKCHALFDIKWKTGQIKRGKCYGWLKREMGLKSDEAHIAKFNIEQCKKLLTLLITPTQ